MMTLWPNPQRCLPERQLQTTPLGCRQGLQPPFQLSPITPFHLNPTTFPKNNKVIFVMGASGTGKSKLAIDLAMHFSGEVVNSDKMQVYEGLDILTNKVTDEERATVPHHLIGGVDPDTDFTATDFRCAAIKSIDEILSRDHVPIVAGGSNSFIEELVDGENKEFRAKYECYFLWVDVDSDMLHEFVRKRVDKMVDMGMVDEVRAVFDPESDCTRGIRRSIGVPEMQDYFCAEASGADSDTLALLLGKAIDDMKAHTCRLTCGQLLKINRLRLECGWDLNRVDASKVFDGSSSWEEIVLKPSFALVQRFMDDELPEKSRAGADVDGVVDFAAMGASA
ncbi:adenylate isopentenyltransferase 5, chloroplastic-like [Dioscorea cayenensis subsp. rotundata]|uniref:adenylate dimethylallyltransferase (ADP/ATP-dependent) n=1 Tax=Dioscorea cayennensis subsp. rotundata TaxID=55577 RepID=A0AB40D276_DIOCR|nr:adenylate isopentenyltransferase 5, chloroplastic-like [Dioscorea cayenensis subsp. rotundata]